jgi:uncharacterized membrane protein (DUF4010 family)
MSLGQPALVALGAALVAALAAIAYWHSRRPPPTAGAGRMDPSTDPGLTSELALFVTYLVGVLCVQQPALGGAAAAVVALLLALRERLHRLASSVISEGELHDALLLAALVLVLLPLAPAAPWPSLGGMSPRSLLLTVVLILAMQGAGHVALRLFGERAGLTLAGLLSGFVSSTATIAAMAGRARGQPPLEAACLAGAMASTLATWAQWALLIAVLAAPALPDFLPAAGAAAVAAAVATGVAWRRAAAQPSPADPQHAEAPPAADGPLRLRPALTVGALLAAVAALVDWAQATWGPGAVLAATALAGLADAHAPVAGLAAQFGSGGIAAGTLATAALLAIASNACTRTATAWVAGGRRFGLAIGLALALQLTAAALTLVFTA